MKWKKLLDIELDKEKKASIQVKALRWLAAFLVLMVLLTLLSRAADSITVAKVTTSSVTSGVLTRTIEAEGTVTANQEIMVSVPSGVRIFSVEVSAGETVEEGDVLFCLDTEDLAKQLSDAEYALNVFLAEQSDQAANAAIAAAAAEKAAARAKEDYETTVSGTNAAVATAKSAMETAKSEYEAAKSSYEKISAVDGADAQEMASAKEKLDACSDAYTAALEVYDAAVADSEQTLKEATRALEDATETTETVDTAGALTTARELETLQAAVDELQSLTELGGEITAPATGFLTSVPLSAGETTSEEVTIRIADRSAGYRFSVSLEREMAKYLSEGDEVTLSIGMSTTVSGLTIDSITASTESSGVYDVTVHIPSKVTDISSFATMTVEKTTQKYDCVVPTAALYSEGDSNYVFVLTESETILGIKTTVEKVAVSVTDKTDEEAAIDGVYRGQEIILSSTKTLRSGDRVKKTE